MTQYVNPVTRIGGVDQIVVPDRPAGDPVDDAPFDDEQYVRVNGEWVPYEAPPIIPDTLAPKAPTGLSGAGTMAGNGSSVDYVLGWSAPTQNTDNSPLTDFAYYVLRWRYVGLTAWSTLTTNDTTYRLPNLLPATNIEWEVLARDTSGNDSSWASNTVTGVADTDPPLQPSQPVLGSRLGTIVVSWDGLLAGASAPPADFAYLDVYMSATSGGPWTAIGRLTSAGVVVAASLTVGDTRFFSFIARDRAGNASTRSTENSIAVLGVQGPDIMANAITANMIATGELSAALTITGYLLAGTPTGSRVVIDGEGIRQYDDTGQLLTNIPTDPSLPATFEGKIIADEMIIKDFMSLQGLANKVARGAVLTLEGGTSSPAVAPSVAVGYETFDANRWSYLFVPGALACNVDGDGSQIIGATTFFGYGEIFGRSNTKWQGATYTDAGGTQRNKYGNIGAGTVVWVGGQERLIINSVYTTGNGATATGKVSSLDLSVMNTSGTVEPTLKAQLNAKLDDYLYYMRLGRVFGGLTGTQYPERIAMGLFKQNGAVYSDTHITLRQYTVTDGVIMPSGISLVSGSEKVVTIPFVTDEGMLGVTHGRVDKLFPGPLPSGVAATDFIWLIHGSVNTYAYNATAGMARVPDYDFPTPPGAARVFAWGDVATNQFLGWRTSAWSDTTPITKLTNNHWVGATSSKWWVSTTNFDSNITGGTHESPQGPRASLTMKKRAALLVTVPPYPVRPDPPTSDDPLSAKIYLGRGASDPGFAAMEYAGQTDDPNRTLLVGDFVFPTGAPVDAPPATGDFPASSPAKVVPGGAARWYLSGDGSAAIGGFQVDTVGTTIASPVHEIVMGQFDQTNQRNLKFRKKNNSSAVQHETRQYAFDGGLATVVYQDAAEQIRTELNQSTGLRVQRTSDSAESVYRPDGITSARMRPVTYEYSDGTDFGISLASYNDCGVRGGRGTFVAPPSGVVRIDWDVALKSGTAGQYVSADVEVRTGSTIGSGTVVRACDPNDSILNFNTQYITGARTTFVTGLTAGSTYNARMMYRANPAGNACILARGRMTITPQP